MIQSLRGMSLFSMVLVLAAALLVSCFCGLLLGFLPISAGALWEILIRHASDLPGAADAVWDLRMPRMVMAAAVGMGLSLSGVVMQAMFKNPMADPYIMGVSSGAALGAASAIFLGVGAAFGAASIGMGAFIGAAALSLLAAVAAGRVPAGNTSYLLIFGAALSAVCGGVTAVLVFTGAGSTGMDAQLYWLMGSVSAAKLGPAVALLLVVLVIFGFFLTQRRILNLMVEGEETSIPLGRRLLPFVRLYLVLNALLCGWIVMNAGIIGFVGLIIPHFTRMALGADHRKLLPAAVLLGGVIAVWADIAGRTIVAGADIPLGVTLALIGAPAFVVMLVRRSYRFGGE